MTDFDDEVERVVRCAGAVSFGLKVVALTVLVCGGITAMTAGRAGVATFIGAVVAGALLYGVAAIIDLLGTQLTESWRQGRRSERAGQGGSEAL